MYDLLNIVIPVYNEGENIRFTLDEIEGKVDTPHGIYIVYDFDGDDTIPVVTDYQSIADSDVTLVKNRYGKGVVNAIRTGFDNVEDGVILVVMADLSDDIDKIDEMFKKINEGYDIVCGSRYMNGGRQIGGPWIKKLLSRTAGITLHFLTGIPTHDITNSFKMYTKDVLNDITLQSDGGFEIGMELVAKAHYSGFRVTEVPCVWTDRQKGESRFRTIRWLPKYMRWYLYALKKALYK